MLFNYLLQLLYLWRLGAVGETLEPSKVTSGKGLFSIK